MQEAHRESIAARDPDSALRYARRWRELGGGAEALKEEAKLLIALGRGGDAAPALFTLKREGATNEEIFRLLSVGRKQDALPLARKMLDDSAEGDLFKARLAADFGEWQSANRAATRALSKAAADSPLLAEMHFTQMQIAGRGSDATKIAPLLDKYVGRGCPGAAEVCDEAKIVYAFALFLDDAEWREDAAENIDEAAFAAGRFFERAGLFARARPHYERARGQFFFADLGLARIAREEGRLEDALAILDSAAVADDGEFGLREVTAAEIVRELYGAKEAVKRISAARRASPDNRELMYEHSLLAEQSGDVPGAAAILERMTELFPTYAEGWNALGYVLADHNLRLDEAERFIKRALTISPGQANILDSLGWVYYRQGRLQEALKYLQEAEAKSESAEISAHLGEVHWRLGEYEKARAAFARGKNRDPDNKVLNETLRRLQIAD